MKNLNINLKLVLLLGAVIFSSCKKSKNTEPETESKPHYVLMTTASGAFGPGYMGAVDAFPDGNISNINANSLQIGYAFGFRTYGKWLFNIANAKGDAGLQKYIVDDNNNIVDKGFLPNAQPTFVIASETKGYYLDLERGLLKIQIFNPTTMQRTGEIDLSSLKKSGIEYQVIGRHTLAVKEGKLYAGITYGTTLQAGFGDDVVNYVEFAVVDVATDKLDKTIKYDGLSGIGWGASGNKMWTLGNDGALYFYATDLGKGFANAAIIRIKKGETEFDKTWILKSNDYITRGTFGTALVKNGKLYTQFASEPLNADLSNFQNIIFEYYVVDLSTKQRTKIAGVPKTFFAWANEQAITEIDGKIYFWVADPYSGIQAYYRLNDDNTTTRVFNVKDGGMLWGFAKLQ